jgi:hypothetical protein
MTKKEKTGWCSFLLTPEKKAKIKKIVEKETLIRSRSHFIDVAIEKLIKEYEKK